MRMRKLSLPATVLILLLSAFLRPARAQDDLLPPDEVADLVERYVERGVDSFREGSYDEAALRYRKALKRDPSNLAALLGVARCRLALGAYDDARAAIAKASKHHPDAREPLVLAAAIDLRQGKLAAVVQVMAPLFNASDRDVTALRAGFLLASAHGARGRRNDAKDVLNVIVAHYKRRYDVLADAAFNADEIKHDVDVARPLSEEMTIIAASLRLYVELFPIEYDFIENAMELLTHARQLDESNWEAWIEYVRVTRVERQRGIARARKAREIVTKRNPELADLYVEVALSVGIGWDQTEQKELTYKALQINPNHPDAHAVLARIQLENNVYKKAAEHIEAALKVNPNHRKSLALKATLSLLNGDKKAFESEMTKTLEVDPKYGEGFHLAGLIVATRQRRLEDALKLVRRGLGVDPTNFEAHTTVGIFLANLGRAEQAIIALKRSREMLPYAHPIRENVQVVLEYVVSTMVEQRTEHFIIRYDPSEYEVHHRYLAETLEAAWADMTARYKFAPKVPVLVECFKTQSDFSVRTIGLPGFPAIGACFGGLITLDSPVALGAPFMWESTAVHEFAHVMSLQISGGQVPRWFTEGLSVLEERPFDSGWGRDQQMERQVADAFLTDTLPKIATFDGMFRSNRVNYAYYVGGLMLDMIRTKWGEEGIVKALRLWGEDKSQRAVFREAFGVSMNKFDAMFKLVIKERVESYRIVPNYGLIHFPLLEQRKKNPKDGLIDVKIGWVHLRRNEIIDSGSYLDTARQKGAGNHPLAILLEANLKWRGRDFAGAEKLLGEYFARKGEDFDARMMLVSALAQKGDRDSDEVIAHLKQAKKNWPLRADGSSPYAILKQIYLSKDMPKEALREMEEQAAILSTNTPLRLALAREYLRVEQPANAIRVLEEAIAVNTFNRALHDTLLPLYREAKLMEKAIRAARCRVALRAEDDTDEDRAMMWLDLAEVLLDADRESPDGKDSLDGNLAKEARAAYDEATKLTDAETLPRIAEVGQRFGA